MCKYLLDWSEARDKEHWRVAGLKTDFCKILLYFYSRQQFSLRFISVGGDRGVVHEAWHEGGLQVINVANYKDTNMTEVNENTELANG